MAKFTSIGKLTKTPSDGTLLERTSKRFLWCWLLLLFFPNWGFLRFRATFPCHRHSTPASQAHKGLHRLWALPWLLSVAFLFARLFPTQLYRERYGFEWAFFTHRRFLPYAPSPSFLEQFVTQMRAGTPHPGFFPVSALAGLSLPADTWTWTTHIVVIRPSIYQLRQWATKYRVKIELLNMFHLFKVMCKDY